MIFEWRKLDGYSLLSLAEVTRLAARFEDAFLEGKRCALEGMDESIVQVVRHGATTLLCVMNESHQPMQYRIPLPAAAGAGSEFYSGRRVDAGEEITCDLAPGDAAVYVLGPRTSR